MFRAGNATANNSLARVRWLAVTLAWAIAGCGAGGNDNPQTPDLASNPVGDSPDLALAERLYAGTDRVPEGFLVESAQYPDRSEFRFHVSNTDIGLGNPGQTRFEMCSDDFAEALQWSALSSAARNFQTTLSATDENDWFFEFDRDVAGPESAMVVSRVFKCATLDRSNRDAAGLAGTLNRAPATAADLKFISEYLWQFSLYNNALHAVVDSREDRSANVNAHIIERAQLLPGGAATAGCDMVEMWHWSHALEPDGILVETDRFVRAFDVRQENGVVTACDP
ncbi:MAG: hypothetical protein AAFO81_03505 [Pseudomonadota bacterium]